MAEATAVIVQKPKMVEIISDVQVGTTITLSNDEAEALIAVLYRVGGYPDKSRRSDIEKIVEALKNVGYKANTSDLNGVLYFEDRP